MPTIQMTTHAGDTLTCPADGSRTLVRVLFDFGMWKDVPLCAGLGKCGLCRVRFRADAPPPKREEIRRLSPEHIDDGWRFSCLHPAEACDIEIPKPVRTARTRKQAETTYHGPFRLAVDLGTTSIHWAALAEGRTAASGTELNPQIALGSEVMSRLALAQTPEGNALLRNLVIDRIRELCSDLSQQFDGPCESISVCGNSAMTYILLGMNVDGLASAPYRLDWRGGEPMNLAPDLPETYFPPLPAPFVGGDLSAGLAALLLSGVTPEYPFMLADLGTNGEFILALSPEKAFCASVPMGPALEGVGLRHGRAAAPGIVNAFAASPLGINAVTVDGGPVANPPGMTGTAYLSLTALLLSFGVLDESGRFQAQTTPLAKRMASGLRTDGPEPILHLQNGLSLAASDVEELLKVKAAFNLAFSELLHHAGIGPGKLAALYIAGAMGEHVGLSDLERLGFIPKGIAARTHRAGNTSLAGATIFLNQPQSRRTIAAIIKTVQPLDLASADGFDSKFLARMRFTHVG